MTSAPPTSEASPPAPQRWRWPDVVLLALILVIAVGLRVTYTDANPTFDELWHIGSTLGIGNVLAYYPHDVVVHDAIRLTSMEHAREHWRVWTGIDGILHPPLFLVALRFWRDLFGGSTTAAHAFSMAWGGVAIAFCFAAARLSMNRSIAVLAGLTLACSQSQVYFSQEIRGYQMLAALGAIAVWLMTRVEVCGSTRRVALALGLLTLPIQLTHYFGFGGALAIGIYGIVRLAPHRRAFLLAVAASAGFFVVAWLPFALRQIDDMGTGDAFLRSDRGSLHVLLLALGAPFRLIAERDYQIELTPLLSGVLFVVPWLLVKRFRPLLPWAVWLCASVAPLVLLDWSRGTVHVAYVRYFEVAAPAVPLLFAGVAWSLSRPLACAVSATLCLTGAIYLFSGNTMPLDADDLSPATRIVQRHVQPGDAIITYSGKAPLYYTDTLMLAASHAPELFPRTLVMLSKPMTPAMIAELGTRTAWLLSGELDRPLEELIPGARVTRTEAATPLVNVMRIEIDLAGTASTSAPTSDPLPVR